MIKTGVGQKSSYRQANNIMNHTILPTILECQTLSVIQPNIFPTKWKIIQHCHTLLVVSCDSSEKILVKLEVFLKQG